MNDTTFNFYKLNGANNTFLVADIRHVSLKEKLAKAFPNLTYSELAKKLCDPYSGMGCDGLFLLDQSNVADFKWYFYNADGSSAEMCGNAARCAALFFNKKLSGPPKVSFETLAGIIGAEVLPEGLVCVTMTTPRELRFNENIIVDNKNINYDFINSGVPHFVTEVNSLDFVREKKEKSWNSTQHQIKQHDIFQPGSTNVTLVKAINEKEVLSLTYERGVEGFTQACGTGAVAAAMSHAHRTGQSEIKVTVPGGLLTVILNDKSPKLIGPAKIISKIEFEY